MNLPEKYNKWVVILLLLVFIGWVKGQLYMKYNVSLAQMNTCKLYSIPTTRGYVYTDFFHVEHLQNSKLLTNELLHLKFYVITSRDAHILLSVNNQPRLLDRVYEIVIGAGRNRFSTIRTNIGRNRVAIDLRPNILSVLDPTPIEIIQTKGGEILTFIPGLRRTPLLNFTDPSPLHINYISFATYDMEPARWFYDCQFDGFAGELNAVQRQLTPLQRLVQDIAIKAENSTMPQNLFGINFAFQIHSINYNSKRAILHTRLDLNLYWNDQRLEWNSSDYENIDTVLYTKGDIWLPKVLIINGVYANKLVYDSYHEIRIYSNGSIHLFLTNAVVSSWCTNFYRNWPNENLDCKLILGLNSGTLQPLPLLFDYSQPIAEVPEASLTEWNFKRLAVTPLDQGVVSRYTDTGIVQSRDGDLVIVFDIARNSTFYKTIFSMPILSSQILLVLSFFLKGYRRGALVMLVMIISLMGLVFLSKYSSISYAPDLMICYQWISYLTIFCYILHVVLLRLSDSPPKSQTPDWLKQVVNYSPLRLVLCLRLADSKEFMNAELQPWHEVAKVLNAFCFVIINLIFILLDSFLLN